MSSLHIVCNLTDLKGEQYLNLILGLRMVNCSCILADSCYLLSVVGAAKTCDAIWSFEIGASYLLQVM